MSQRYHGRFLPIPAAVAAVGAAWWWRMRPFAVFVEGTSMAPALKPGEFLVATRRGRLRRGALVVVGHPGRPGYEMVKRLAGLPGDVVRGKVLGGEEYWVLGDAPGASTDSRTLGPVRRSELRGVVRFRYWPPGRAGLL